ncbi:flagellar hook-basal body protein [Flavisphingomonas formosensis]|uniref:flagellar hook-basal body protein n=1 Tax=Flavisphingomonas formosensis TaxID=861534 RepID=UPI0012F98952|nr:flagellar hook-basal body complex protein [Sphingomonas formosensis]
MGGIIHIGGTLLARAEERAAVIAQNMANLATPGYRSVGSFARLVTVDDPESSANADTSEALFPTHATRGKLIESGSPLDLALAGNGYFVVRKDDAQYLTRAGQFHRDDLGRLLTANGDILQTDHGDAVLAQGEVLVSPDGSISQSGRSIGRIMVMDVANPAALRPAGSARFLVETAELQEVASPVVRQGMVEASNVSQAGEMLALMQVMRSAEAGQRLVQTYDDLVQQAITSFNPGQS